VSIIKYDNPIAYPEYADKIFVANHRSIL